MHVRLMEALTIAVFVSVLIAGTLAHAAKEINNLAIAPRSAELLETGVHQRRDLSIPGSRIVINPYNFQQPASQISPAAYSNRPSLPLNVGYLAEAASERELTNALTLYKGNDAVKGGINVGWKADFNALNDWSIGYRRNDTTYDVSNGALTVNVAAKANPVWQQITTKKNITVDLDATPILEISVPKSTGLWAVKVNDGRLPSDAILRGDASGTGVFQYDISKATGWKGRKSFKVIVFAIGTSASITIDSMAMVGVHPRLEEAKEYQTEWLPHKLGFTAEYSDGTAIKGEDFFYDENTVVRKAVFSGPASHSGTFCIAGSYSGDIHWDQEAGSLLIDKGSYSYAVSSNARNFLPLRFYRTSTDLTADNNPLTNPPSTGWWMLEFDLSDLKNDCLVVSAAFAGHGETRDTLIRRVQEPIAEDAHQTDKVLKEHEKFWDDYLQSVPCPERFDITAVDSKGVTPEQIRSTYYKAWVLLAQTLLPSDESVQYPYPQMATGKPSLWAEGHPKSPFTASWDSLMGIQLYAYVDSHAAWDAFTGLMSLVSESGQLGGESLPSRKAQTAMILYTLTGDKDRLREVYPALKRYTDWRIQNPRWIFKEHDNPNEKDAEFVVSVIADMGYMSDIARILDIKDDVRGWEEKRKALFNQYLEWFWTTPFDKPIQYYITDNGASSPGNTLWVTTGLYIDMLDGPYLESMMDRFYTDFDTDKSFGGFSYPKYPDYSYTIYGLIKKGYSKEAAALVDIAMRDIVRTGGVFAESYTNDNPPYPSGVRPSLFGAAQIIDAVLLKNGYDYDKGSPHVVRLFEGNGGVASIKVRDIILNITVKGEGQTGEYEVSGGNHKSGTSSPIRMGQIIPVDIGDK